MRIKAEERRGKKRGRGEKNGEERKREEIVINDRGRVKRRG